MKKMFLCIQLLFTNVHIVCSSNEVSKENDFQPDTENETSKGNNFKSDTEKGNDFLLDEIKRFKKPVNFFGMPKKGKDSKDLSTQLNVLDFARFYNPETGRDESYYNPRKPNSHIVKLLNAAGGNPAAVYYAFVKRYWLDKIDNERIVVYGQLVPSKMEHSLKVLKSIATKKCGKDKRL